jgi:hypothetical protein
MQPSCSACGLVGRGAPLQLPPGIQLHPAAARLLQRLQQQAAGLVHRQHVLVWSAPGSSLDGSSGALAALAAVRLGAARAVLALLLPTPALASLPDCGPAEAAAHAAGGRGSRGVQAPCSLAQAAVVLQANAPLVVAERLRCVRVPCSTSSMAELQHTLGLLQSQAGSAGYGLAIAPAAMAGADVVAVHQHLSAQLLGPPSSTAPVLMVD